MTSKRTPLRRDMARRITPEAVEAFKRMEALRASCTCLPRDWEGKYWEHEPCASCEAWWDAHSILHDALRLPVSQYPAFEYPDDTNPWPEDSNMGREWTASRPHVDFTLYHELKAASETEIEQEKN